jgi:hypothetical protein
MVGLILEVVIKRYSIEILHDDVEMVVCLHDVQYLYNVRVAQHLKDSYLSSY